ACLEQWSSNNGFIHAKSKMLRAIWRTSVSSRIPMTQPRGWRCLRFQGDERPDISSIEGNVRQDLQLALASSFLCPSGQSLATLSYTRCKLALRAAPNSASAFTFALTRTRRGL